MASGQPKNIRDKIYVVFGHEWLTDASLPEQIRREEAQTIVDALTGCIRTPYPLAAKSGKS